VEHIAAKHAEPCGPDTEGKAGFLGDLAEDRFQHKVMLGIEKLLNPSTVPRWRFLEPIRSVPASAPLRVWEGDDSARAAELASHTVSAPPYDVFLCHNSRDRAGVLQLRDALAYLGISSWMDSDMIGPGDQPAAEIERVIEHVPAVALILGANGMGPWQRQEYYVFLARITSSSHSIPPVRLVPVLMPGVAGSGDLPPFAKTHLIVDLRTDWADGVARLASGVRTAGRAQPSRGAIRRGSS
jgi:hypothetical protein